MVNYRCRYKKALFTYCLEGGKPKNEPSSKMRADHATIEKATIADNATIAACRIIKR